MQDKVGFGRTIDRLCDLENIEKQIHSTLMFQLVDQYGWKAERARRYINEYLTMDRSKRLTEQIFKRYNLFNKRVLEVGSGLGNILIQMKLNGIDATGIEPSEEFCRIIKRRLELHSLDVSSVVKGSGENLPFGDCTFDFLLSMQVLEHVNDPESVLAEMNRVLRPNGICYITAPNYLSFRENHYRLFWLPLLPRPFGTFYLRLRGRNPLFFQNHINYTTFPKVLRTASQYKWENLILTEFLRRLGEPELIQSKSKGALARLIHYFNPFVFRRLGTTIYYLQNLFRPEILYMYRKP